MSTIRIRGNNKDIDIKSIVYENPKIIKQVILPQGEFKKNEITEKKYFTNITIPGFDVEIEIFGSIKNKDGDIYYKNYKINNVVFNCEDNPTTTMTFETDIKDIYKIKIISQEKSYGNAINPGKLIQKIFNIDYKFRLYSESLENKSQVLILKSDFSSNININLSSDNDEDNKNIIINQSEEDDEDDEDDDEDELQSDNEN